MTGWKSVFVNKGFTKRINGVTKDESDILLQYLFNVRTRILIQKKEGKLMSLYSFLLKITMLRFATNGIKTTLPSGITDPTGIVQHMITMKAELVTESVVLAKPLISI